MGYVLSLGKTAIYAIGGYMLDVTPTAQATFSSDQVQTISNSINTAITNTINMFVSLVPLFAVICGAAFGIRFVKGLFSKVGGNKIK